MQIHNPILTGSFSYNGADLSNITSSNATSASLSSRTTQIEQVYATTGSNSFRANQSITGSLTVTGTIVAQTLNVQQVTSSIVYSSGSNVFGCDINSRQTFTGSFYQTGSVAYFSNCVGIGTASPSHLFTVVGGTTTPGSFSGGNYYLGIYSGSVSTVLRETFALGSDNCYVYMQSFSSKPLYINSAGNNIILGSAVGANNVGIGTTSPAAKFAISNGGAEGFEFIPADSSNYNRLQSYSRSGGVYNTLETRASTHIWAIDATERMRITSGGNVGIGTCCPVTKLEIANNGTNVYSSTVTSNTNSNASLAIGVGGSAVGVSFLQNNAYILNNGTSDLIFGTNGGTERMRITCGGNVGIGTCCPSALLHIALPSTAASGETLRLVSKDAIGDVYQTFYRFGGTTRKGYLGYGYGSQDYFEINQEENSDIIISTNSSEKMRIAAGGLTTLSGPTLSAGTQGTYALQVGEPGYPNLTLGYKQATAGYIQTWSSTALYLNQQGNAVYAGSVRLDTLSDQRIKDNIQPITNSLDKVLQLTGKKFHLMDEPEDKIRYGFIAQDLEGILDEFVIDTEMKFEKDGYIVENVKSVENWASSWSALLVEAIKEQQTQIQELKAEINELKNK